MPRKDRPRSANRQNPAAVFWGRRRSVAKLQEGLARLQVLQAEMRALLAAVDQEIAAGEKAIREHLSYDNAGRLFTEKPHAGKKKKRPRA